MLEVPDALLQRVSSDPEAGVAELLELLLEAAGFEARTINGYARGIEFSPLVDEPVNHSDHAWTAVEIESAWYLMDTTWDARWSTNGTWEHHYRSAYLFAEPTAFATTHLPTDPAWQLLESPLDAESFVAQAHTSGEFYLQGLAFVVPPARTQHVGATTSVRGSVPAGVKLTGGVGLMAPPGNGGPPSPEPGAASPRTATATPRSRPSPKGCYTATIRLRTGFMPAARTLQEDWEHTRRSPCQTIASPFPPSPCSPAAMTWACPAASSAPPREAYRTWGLRAR